MCHMRVNRPHLKKNACIDCVVMSLLNFLTKIDCGGLSLFLSRLETDATFYAVQTTQQIFFHIFHLTFILMRKIIRYGL